MSRTPAQFLRFHHRALRAAPGVLALCSTNFVLATDPNPQPQAATQPAALAPSPSAFGLSGDWGGARQKLVDQGISVGGLLQLEYSKNARGGVDTADDASRSLLNLNVQFDLQTLANLQGANVFAELQNHEGPDASAKLAGDTQGFDSIDGPHFSQVSQLWYRQRLDANDTTWFKVGKIDANTDFSVIEHGKDFNNTSFSYSATMLPFPTYPDSAGGGETFASFGKNLYAGAGAFYINRQNTFLTFTGHPGVVERANFGTFFIGELGSRWNLQDTELAGHAAVGGWGHTGRFSQADSTRQIDGSGGGYAFYDQSIWQAKVPAGVRDVGFFLDGGWADPSTNPLTTQLGGGIASTGPLPFRPLDTAGAAVSIARLGHGLTTHRKNETAVEVFYKVQLCPGATLKPDVQYIVDPGGTHSDALLLSVRLELTL